MHEVAPNFRYLPFRIDSQLDDRLFRSVVFSSVMVMANTQQLVRLESGAIAWNEWRQDNPNVLIDLSDAVLRHRDLAGINLSEANLTGADLRGAQLQGADLTYANLCHAKARNANLQATVLDAAIAWNCDFRGARLRQASLIQADVRDSRFDEADMISVNARQSYLSGVSLDGAYAIGASFKGANLRLSTLCEANLKQADLSNAYLRWSTLYGANLCYADLSTADLSESNFADANLSYSNLQQVQAIGTDFRRANLKAACVQDWVVSAETRFDPGVCENMFLQSGHEPWSDLATSAIASDCWPYSRPDIVELRFSSELNWHAFAHAIGRTNVQNPSAQLSIKTIQHTPNHGVLVQLRVLPNSNQTKLYYDFIRHYERAIPLAYAAQRRSPSGAHVVPQHLLSGVLQLSKHLSRDYLQQNH